MSTNVTQVNLAGSLGDTFTKTNTDDAWGEAVNPDSLSLYKVLLGETLTGGSGSYTAGAGAMRIYNTVTKEVKAMELLNIITEEVYFEFREPVVVEQNDILQVFTVATPT